MAVFLFGIVERNLVDLSLSLSLSQGSGCCNIFKFVVRIWQYCKVCHIHFGEVVIATFLKSVVRM
jgi:hypothetical protein